MNGASPFPSLNPAQRAAVEHEDGPLLVVAGAGSGKTRVLTARIARLIAERGIAPQEILAVTFTNKAAGEMRERVGRALGEAPTGMWIGTFHGIGARLLRANAALVGRTPEYTIYDQNDLLGVIKRLMKKHGISTDEYEPKGIAAEISAAMNALVGVAEFEDLARTGKAQAAAKVYRDLEETLRAANAVCFDDLLVLPVRILREHEDVRLRLARRFRHVLVDEYQDTNRAQYEFVRLVAGEHRNVAVVGDDDQAIYGWRGADIRNILDFERDYPNAKVVRLEENYRSSAGILELANTVISANLSRRGKTLRATRDGGEPVVLLEAADDRDEAEAVAEAMQEWRRSGHRYSDAAVLYRTNAQSRGMEDAMRRAGVPYRLVGATRFYDRQEIRDLIAWLRLVANPQDDEAFRRAISAPKRGIGDTSVELLAAEATQAGVPLLETSRRAAQGLLPGIRPALKEALDVFVSLVDRLRTLATDMSVDRLLAEIIEHSGYAAALRKDGPEGLERLANVEELKSSAAEVVIEDGGEVGQRPLDHFLQGVTLVTALDQLGPDADAVTMMTVHTAKGLEYGFVFVTGLEDGLFPLIRFADQYDDAGGEDAMEEERRLLYVAITRAGERLVLSWARQRLRGGTILQSRRSRLLDQVDESTVDYRRTVRLRSTSRLAAPTREPSWRRSPRGDSAAGAGAGGARFVRRSPKAEWSPREADIPSFVADEEASQDLPRFVPGERVAHGRFGSGTIAEVSGTGKDAKVTVDFDDETVGRKRLVIAFAGLQRAFE
ncbi:MAG: UvrD-helicase domain-containing protein [Gemmatimonadaceae bacterium]|nr:UvrD-helicase domain-containing protein [Gemmatimonadaceae bacterium]MCW5825052.1 UvrD-helicase domain-containing protein [Gemmatimonadaceae bacterium]